MKDKPHKVIILVVLCLTALVLQGCVLGLVADGVSLGAHAAGAIVTGVTGL